MSQTEWNTTPPPQDGSWIRGLRDNGAITIYRFFNGKWLFMATEDGVWDTAHPPTKWQPTNKDQFIQKQATMTFEEYALKVYPDLHKQYELFCMTSEELIGRTVIATSSGFSCGREGGTEMIIEKIEGGRVSLRPTKNSRYLNALGWQTELDTLPQRVRLID